MSPLTTAAFLCALLSVVGIVACVGIWALYLVEQWADRRIDRAYQRAGVNRALTDDTTDRHHAYEETP